ncbi:hypothetical protein [Algoriphagus sp.]|uniref:hypothetical protein n=1 Tax=Algoriphagus sp. TaxID=1872435 RepID=UPI0025DCD45E|nr:hypothetical protein [Algoriphagus sp.]
MRNCILTIILLSFFTLPTIAQNKENSGNQVVNPLQGIILRLDSLKNGFAPEDEYEECRYCLAQIALYVIMFENLDNQIMEAKDCQNKYDLLGLESQMLLGSTTFMYCTEQLFNYLNYDGPDGRRKMEALVNLVKYNNYIEYVLGDVPFSRETNLDVINKEFFLRSFESVGLDADELGDYYEREQTEEEKFRNFRINSIILNAILLRYFHPMALMKEALVINQRMAALPCSDGVKR